jgi:hypothetical protein
MSGTRSVPKSSRRRRLVALVALALTGVIIAAVDVPGAKGEGAMPLGPASISIAANPANWT